jgi:hypothetical protein
MVSNYVIAIDIAAQLAFIENYANMETGCHLLYKK